jgi:photosystem II stability/assembly factor-like uncharacterized protein
MKSAGILWLMAAVFSGSDLAFSQTWIQQTNAPSKNFEAMASSADGSKLVAVTYDYYDPYNNPHFGGPIYTSTNSGDSWMEASNAAPAQWTTVTSSADGKTLVALPAGGSLYVSTDFGATWAPINTPSSFLNCIALSADGSKLTAGEWDDFVPTPSLIYTTANSGATWSTNNAPSEYWTSIASSAGGTKLVAVAETGPIYTSVDSGATWNATLAPEMNWYAVASSVDGVKLVAAPFGGKIYTSTNSGVDWTPTKSPDLGWFSLASSADGTHLVAAENDSYTVYSSTDSGATWTQANVPAEIWQSVACSADGNEFVAVSFQGSVYRAKAVPQPQLNLAAARTNVALAWLVPSANFGLQYSTDLISWVNLTNTPTLNLTNLQNQVVLPPSGSGSFFRLSTP